MATILLIRKAADLVQQATKEEIQENYIEAVVSYEESISYFVHAIQSCDDYKIRGILLDKCRTCLDRAESLVTYLKGDRMRKEGPPLEDRRPDLADFTQVLDDSMKSAPSISQNLGSPPKSKKRPNPMWDMVNVIFG